MKTLSASGLFVGALLSGLLAAGPAGAAAGYCDEECSGNTYCTATCLVCGFNSGPEYVDGTCENPEVSTCGDESYQCIPWTCTPNWVITSSTAVGGFAEQSYIPAGCYYNGVSIVTYHDQNNCGQADYQECKVTFHTFRSDYACCSEYWCGGNTCGLE